MQTIFVAGHKGMVGSALVRQLKTAGQRIVTRDKEELDLTRQVEVDEFFANEQIDQVYLAAAKVGGIIANNEYPAEFIYQNLMIQSNVLDAAYRHKVSRLLFLGSSCIYPRLAEQPISEKALLTGKLEPTNEPYAISKIAGIKLCESYNRQYATDYRSVMPTNLYGIGDNFHPQNSHVIPGLMNRIHEAKITRQNRVTVWGSGRPKREFLFADDMAAACVYVMGLSQTQYWDAVEPMQSHINVGTGEDCSISELVEMLVNTIGYEGEVVFDTTKPDGAPRKLLNVDLLSKLGWQAKTPMKEGLAKTYEWYLDNVRNG